jgi:hypothetical protein
MPTLEELKQLAAAGIRAEISRLTSLLAELEGSEAAALPTGSNDGQVTKRRGRRNLTDAQRKEISRRMKAMWRAKRKAREKGA